MSPDEPPPKSSEPADLFADERPVSELLPSVPWKSTGLGAPDAWPRSLRSMVRMMLASRYAMWMGWGPELTFLYNDAYRPTLGVKHPWALGRPAREVWSEIWADIGPLATQVLQTGEATYNQGMLLFLERSGFPEETYHTFSYSPLFDDDGAVAGLLCVVVEETERIISERRLGTLRGLAAAAAATNAEPELFAAVQDQLAQNPHDLPFAMAYLFDGDRRTATLVAASGIVAGHAAARRSVSLGEGFWPLEPLLGNTPAVVVDHLAQRFGDLPAGAWDKPPVQALLVPIAQRGHERSAAGFLVAGVNPYRPLDQGYRGFIELVAGQIGAALGNVRAYEEERQRAEALAEIDRAKTAFFSNVSHEFRTPLTLMLGPLEELLADPHAVGQEARRRIELAHRNGARLLRLVNSLLDFSRIEAGRVTASYAPTDLAAVSAEIASSFRSVLERAGLTLAVEAEDLGEPVYVDREMWEKVLLNLLSNAFKFTFEGRIRVRIGRSPDGGSAVVEVRDSGIGIPPEELPRLFERFHRVEGARGRSFEGSGIGLALVHELVKLHGGSIAVDSQVGRGTEFTIALPFGARHLPSAQVRPAPAAPADVKAEPYLEEAARWLPELDETPAAAVDGEGPMAASRTGRRVLLADDNADMRDYVRRLLSAQGYQVRAVEDGEAALEALGDEIPDLVLTDVMMPRLDGFGLLRALRADPRLADVPVILLSARAGEEAKIEGFEAGADDYLIKPFAARELLARVRANMELAAGRREQNRLLRGLNAAMRTIAAEIELEKVVQAITDAAVEATGAAFGAFFYNVADEAGERYMLYTLSGAPREAFERYPMPRNSKVFAPTFAGEGVVRSADITRDPRYGRNPPHYGLPDGHLPVRSYLAAPVKSRTGEVIGGLFFGHPEAGVFTARAEELVLALCGPAAVAMDNARLFEDAQRELAQRRRAEAELQTLNATLEQRVVEEVQQRAKAEDALRQAQKMEAVGQLTGGVAHDFNNLLTVIIGGLDTIRRSGPEETARIRRAADMALQGAQRAANLTGRLLAFSRRQPLDPRPLDLNILVRDMTELLHRTLGEQIDLEVVLGQRLWPIEADQNQLESAIVNLAVNARDAMPDGGKLTIETANASLDESYAALDAEVRPGQYAMIAVSDTGTGMSHDILARVFEPFFTTKPVGRGTGLGLSMVYGFVKQSGGHVTVYSEEGQGTTVKLYFPRHGGEAGARRPERESLTPMASRDEVVLVVEDNEDVRGYSTTILGELGYRVLEAPDADAALAMLEREPRVDLLFTDVVLPGRNGRLLADSARALKPGLKVLFTTGYSRNAIVHHGRLDPGVNLVSKPFTFEELAARVRDVLDRA